MKLCGILSLCRQAGTNQGGRFVPFSYQPRPRAPELARELVRAAAIFVDRRRNRRRIRNASAGLRAAHIGEGAIVAHALLSGIWDMGAQSSREVQRPKDEGRRGLGIRRSWWQRWPRAVWAPAAHSPLCCFWSRFWSTEAVDTVIPKLEIMAVYLIETQFIKA
jgi:hypothetical protein